MSRRMLRIGMSVLLLVAEVSVAGCIIDDVGDAVEAVGDEVQDAAHEIDDAVTPDQK